MAGAAGAAVRPRTAVVTGGAQGIGYGIVEALMREGCRVALWDYDREAGEEAQAKLTGLGTPGACAFVQCDVSNESDVVRAVQSTVQFGGSDRIDCLVNNAGLSIFKPIESLSLAEWNHIVGVNLTGAFLCTKYSLPHLRQSAAPAIVNIASTRAFQSEPGGAAYGASKGGMVALTHALAVDLGPKVRVNCVSPGWIDVTDVKKASARNQQELRDLDHLQHPCGRVGNIGDVASMVLFLLDPKNSFLTGHNYFVDGGMPVKMIYED